MKRLWPTPHPRGRLLLLALAGLWPALGAIGAVLAVALAAGPALAIPAIPSDAIQTGQTFWSCESGPMLRYMYEQPDGTVIVTFKQPNKEPRIYLRWKPGNDGAADEIWVDAKQMTLDELRATYPSPCAVFDAVTS